MTGKGNVITLFYRSFQRLRYTLDPDRWMARFLNLPNFHEGPNRRGLILIQIDGLSFGHLKQAAAEGRLPFLKRLVQSERYHEWHHYSGIPSSTPSIQGELFYGVKQCVPAFKFRDHKTGDIFTFYNSYAAREIESRLKDHHEGLLQHGSSYSNIFRGGAEENAHFCVASVGWSAFLKALKPSTLTVFILLNLLSFIRMLFYLILEFFLALFGSMSGSIKGFGFSEEIKFILSRLIVTIGFREFAVLGTKLDLARGLPIIHVNFFGYDDQAHRRGPGSKFAYWALPGIDAAIKRIWEAAQNSVAKDYEIWIYSDHGQEEVVPYAVENGKRIEKAVADLFHQMIPNEIFELAENDLEKNIGCRISGHPPVMIAAHSSGTSIKKMYVTAQGPIGFIYPHRELSSDEKEYLAQALVQWTRIPLVLILMDQAVYGFTSQVKFKLPEEIEKIIGADHPYFQEVSEELLSLCRHPDAGTFIISGWRKDERSVSFPQEYGSHAGPGPHETDGFALLPPDIRILSRKYLRPLALRNAALKYLKGDKKIFYGQDPGRAERHTLRIMTYNVHSCRGMDGKLSPERIAGVIARHDPDIIALQELDVGRLRTEKMDQANAIAKLLDMEHHFHPVRMIEEEMFGNAILSRYPFKVIRAGALPRLWHHSYFEPRGALWIEIQYGEIPVQIMNTHLSFWAHEQKKQMETLCSPEWLADKDCDGNIIVCGDFNALPSSITCQSISKTLQDVQLKMDRHRPLNTWFGHFPIGRIDHIFVSRNISVRKVEVPNGRLERLASDHLPLIAEIHLKMDRSENLRLKSLCR